MVPLHGHSRSYYNMSSYFSYSFLTICQLKQHNRHTDSCMRCGAYHGFDRLFLEICPHKLNLNIKNTQQ